MQVQVADTEASFIETRERKAPATSGTTPIDGITSAIVWLSYCGLVSAGIAVMTW